MRAMLVWLTMVVGAVAAVAPLVAANLSVDAFAVGLAAWTFTPFAVLAGIDRWVSVLGLLLTLVALAVAEWLALAEFLGSSDGLAGFVLIFVPFFMLVVVLLVPSLDVLARLLVRRVGDRQAA